MFYINSFRVNYSLQVSQSVNDALFLHFKFSFYENSESPLHNPTTVKVAKYLAQTKHLPELIVKRR